MNHDCKSCNCKNAKKVNFTKNTKISEVLASSPKSRLILEGFGLHCLGCPMSQMETLEEAAKVHDLDLNFMLDKLNSKN